jgi:hypothetical protein
LKFEGGEKNRLQALHRSINDCGDHIDGWQAPVNRGDQHDGIIGGRRLAVSSTAV